MGQIKEAPKTKQCDCDMCVGLIARTCHEVNRAYCQSIGDMSQLPWAEAPQWQKDSAVDGVRAALDGATPERLHESWCEKKASDGWVYGESKDADRKTHPCLVPYAELPQAQRVKDDLFAGVVGGLSTAIADSSVH